MRATCAQALGVVANFMTEKAVTQTGAVLLLLASQSQWEVRHASLMGMQHLLAARTVRSMNRGSEMKGEWRVRKPRVGLQMSICRHVCVLIHSIGWLKC